MSLLKPDRNNKTTDFMSFVIRIHDNQREWMPPKGYLGDLSTAYLPQDRLQSYLIPTDPKFSVATGADAARSMIPMQLQSKDAFKNACEAAFKKVRLEIVNYLEI